MQPSRAKPSQAEPSQAKRFPVPSQHGAHGQGMAGAGHGVSGAAAATGRPQQAASGGGQIAPSSRNRHRHSEAGRRPEREIEGKWLRWLWLAAALAATAQPTRRANHARVDVDDDAKGSRLRSNAAPFRAVL